MSKIKIGEIEYAGEAITDLIAMAQAMIQGPHGRSVHGAWIVSPTIMRRFRNKVEAVTSPEDLEKLDVYRNRELPSDGGRLALLEDVFSTMAACRIHTLAKRDTTGGWIPVPGELGMSRSEAAKALASLNGGSVPMPREYRGPASPTTPLEGDQLLLAVAERLRGLGFSTTLEYPGFIQAASIDGRHIWNIGKANVSWGMDRTNADGSEFLEAHDFPGSESWTDPALIALAIAGRMAIRTLGDGK